MPVLSPKTFTLSPCCFYRRAVYFLLLALLCLPLSAQNSQKVRQMKAQRNELKKQIDDNERLLRSTKRDVASQMNNLALLDAQIGEHEKYMAGVQHEIDSLGKCIELLNREITTLQNEVLVCKANYRRAMTYVSRTRLQQSRWTFVFMAKDFRTMYRRMRYAAEFSKNQQARGLLIAKKEEALRQKQATLLSAKAEQDRLLAEARTTRATLDQKKQERQAMVDDLNKKQANLQAGISRQRRQYNNLNARIDQLIQQEIAAAEQRRRAEEARRRREEENRRRAEEQRRRDEARRQATAGKGKTTGKNKKKSTTKGNAGGSGSGSSNTGKPDFHEPSGADRQLSSNFAANRGRLPAPISGSFAVTSRFGKYEVQGLGGVMLDNKGVNLTGHSGAQARSVFNGEVSAVANMGGTYIVIVRHGDYYSVYSNLSSVSVRRGQQVKTSQTLGAVAGDGAGNTMLHFQLRHNTEKLNPLSWIVH